MSQNKSQNDAKHPPDLPGVFISRLCETFDYPKYRLARLAGIDNSTFTRILNGERIINARHAVLLSRAISTIPELPDIAPEVFCILQVRYDIYLASKTLKDEGGYYFH